MYQVTLSQEVDDKIKWTQNANGIYFTKSAYLAQIHGAKRNVSFKIMWSAEAQSKQRFLGWLILHQKTLTAENLLIRHWPCEWICYLCTEAFENAFVISSGNAKSQNTFGKKSLVKRVSLLYLHNEA